MQGIKICGTGSYLPSKVVENNDFAAILDTSDEWIRTRTGISSRHFADGETTWQMGARAAERALDSSGIPAGEIGLILVTTVTPDYSTPSMSCIIQNHLGAKNAVCIDLNAACTGFVYAFDMARRYLSCGDMRYVLIIGSEMLTRIANFEDRGTCVLLGDGAGACVVRACGAPFGAYLGSDGTGCTLMFSKRPYPVTPFTAGVPGPDEIYARPEGVDQFVMGGSDVYKFATKMMPFAIEQACVQAGIAVSELDWIVPHQANIRIVQTAMKNLGLPMEKAQMTIDHTGNTSSASIPIALDQLARAGKLKEGQKVALCGFGGGLTYGGAVFSW